MTILRTFQDGTLVIAPGIRASAISAGLDGLHSVVTSGHINTFSRGAVILCDGPPEPWEQDVLIANTRDRKIVVICDVDVADLETSTLTHAGGNVIRRPEDMETDIPTTEPTSGIAAQLSARIHYLAGKQ